MFMSDRATDPGNLKPGNAYGGGWVWGNDGRWRAPENDATSQPQPTGSGGSTYSAPSYSYADMMADIMAAQRRAREEAYQKAAAQQKQNYNYAQGQVDDTTNKALQQAYINKMLTLKNMPQSLTAQGLNGGSSETTTASMYNNYGNARNNLETERQKQMAALLNTYQNNMAQLEAQRASGDAASLADFVPQLASLAATNAPQTVNLTQGAAESGGVSTSVLERLRRALGLDDEEYEY